MKPVHAAVNKLINEYGHAKGGKRSYDSGYPLGITLTFDFLAKHLFKAGFQMSPFH